MNIAELPSTISLHKETVSVRGKLVNGSSCEVYKAVTSDGSEAVLKLVPIRSEHPSLRSRFLREIECLKRVSGQPNIVRLLDYKEDDRLRLGLVLEEYCSQGSLRQMCSRQELTENQLITILKDVCCGLCQLHNRGIAHRDLRPGNILIGNDFRCRLADFSSATTTFYDSLPESDLAAVLEDIETNTSPIFRAPEQMSTKAGAHLNQMVDMWGLGCLIYGLLFRESPFDFRSASDLSAGRYKPPNRPVSEFWIRVLNVLFVPDPRERATAEEVLRICIQTEIPKLIVVEGVRPVPVRPAASIGDFFKTSTDSWVRAATSNFDAPPDQHYVNKLLNKAWQKPFKVAKFYHSLLKRPLYKTRVASKSLILTHLYVLHGPAETLSQLDGGIKRFLATIDSIWHPKSHQPFDDLYCEYFAGLVRQYSKVLKMKLALHNSSGLRGDWRGNGQMRPENVGDMFTYWTKLIHMSSGLMLDVSELPQVRASLAGLLMQEKLRLMRVVAETLCELLRLNSSNVIVPELLTRFQQSYQQTRTIAITLKRIRPMLSFDIPSEELPEDLAKLVDSRRKPQDLATGRVLVAEEEILSYISRFESSHQQDSPEARIKTQTSPQAEPKEQLDEGRSITEEAVIPQTVDLLDFTQEPIPANSVESSQFTNSPFVGMQPMYPFLTANPTLPGAVATSEPQQAADLLPMATKEPLASEAKLKAEADQEIGNPSLQSKHLFNPFLSDLFKPGAAGQPVELFPGIVNPTSETWIVKAQDLQFGNVLGAGASCTVYCGVYKRTPVAIKVMKTSLNADLKKEFYREITALLRIRHPNLVLFMGACIEPRMSIITEFCKGENLFKLLHERKDVMLSWKQRLKMCKDVAQGMHYLHESVPPILHRDLKSLNLLLHEPVNSPGDAVIVKITDFGISRVMGGDGLMTGQMGTCHWMAPEVLGSLRYGLPADVYSYGIVVWEIVCRETPYQHLAPMAIADRVLHHGERPNLSSVPPSCPALLKDLMTKCWHSDPRRRPTFTEILDVLDTL